MPSNSRAPRLPSWYHPAQPPHQGYPTSNAFTASLSSQDAPPISTSTRPQTLKRKAKYPPSKTISKKQKHTDAHKQQAPHARTQKSYFQTATQQTHPTHQHDATQSQQHASTFQPFAVKPQQAYPSFAPAQSTYQPTYQGYAPAQATSQSTYSGYASAQPTLQKKYPTDEDFRVESSTWGQVDPIGITNGAIPLTAAEASRIRQWSWTSVDDAATNISDSSCSSLESPRGSRLA